MVQEAQSVTLEYQRLKPGRSNGLNFLTALLGPEINPSTPANPETLAAALALLPLMQNESRKGCHTRLL